MHTLIVTRHLPSQRTQGLGVTTTFAHPGDRLNGQHFDLVVMQDRRGAPRDDMLDLWIKEEILPRLNPRAEVLRYAT